MDLINPLESRTIGNLIPGTLNKKGIDYAPRTLSSLVYMDDGTRVSEVMKDMISDNKRFILQTKTEQAEATSDKQRVFRIPAPLETYDFTKYPLMISLNGELVDSINYTLHELQLIFKEEFSASIKKGDVIMFIFHYLDIIMEDSTLDAESINKVRFFVEAKEPIHKRTTDVWFDISHSEVKRFNGETWDIIVSGQGDGTGGGGINALILKNTVEVSNETDFVNIGISGFDKNKDTLFVYQNSAYQEKGEDYNIDDSNTIITPINGKWDGREDVQVFNFIVFKKGTSGGSGGGDGGLVDGIVEGKQIVDRSIEQIKLDKAISDKLDKIEQLEKRMIELENSAIYPPLSTDGGIVILTSDNIPICAG